METIQDSSEKNPSIEVFIPQNFLSENINQIDSDQNQAIFDGTQCNDFIILNDANEMVFFGNQKNPEIFAQEEIYPPYINNILNGFNEDLNGLKEEEVIINYENEENDSKCFPFTKGIGIEKTFAKMGIIANYDTKSKLTLSQYFKTTGYYTDVNGRRRKEKKKRKDKPDDIRKKIKARFHKAIKDIINEKLKKAGATKLFDYMPQTFITNITVEENRDALNLTYDELMKEKKFISKKRKNLSQDNLNLGKYEKNLEVFEYLEKNPKISENSEFDRIKKMTYAELLQAFFLSKEFEDSLIKLIEKKERLEYLEDYVNKAITYVSFFTFKKKRKKKVENNEGLSCNDNVNLRDKMFEVTSTKNVQKSLKNNRLSIYK